MSNENLTKIKGQVPVSVIVHGGNYISFLLAKTLLEQGSHVVIIDKYTNNSKQYFTELKKTGKVSFIDFKGLKTFYEKVARIDYLYYMLGERAEEIKNVDSKDFLAEADYLNQSIASANKYKAKISLVTSLRLNRELSNLVNNEQTGKTKPYTPLELQRYGENFCAEYVDKTKANLRIIRLGTVLGRGITKISNPILDKLFSDATQKSQIEIEGEGLEIHNIINESDVVYGILKLTFSDDTKGEVITLCNNNDYSTLSIAYKLLELDVEAEAIKFVERTDGSTILQDLYVPAPHASQYGWKQNIPLEETTIQQVQAYYEKEDKKWEIDKTERENNSTLQTAVTQTKLGVFVSSITKPIQKFKQPNKLFQEINYGKIFKNISLLIFLVLLLYYLVTPIIGIVVGAHLIQRQGKNLRESITQLNFDEIDKITDSLSTNTSRVEDSFNRLSWLFSLLEKKDEYVNLSQVIQGTKYIAEGGQDLAIGLKPLAQYVNDFTPSISFESQNENAQEYTSYLEAIKNNKYILQEGTYKILLAQSLISSADTRNYPSLLKTTVNDYKDLVSQISKSIKPISNVSEFLPDLLGLNQRRRYIILLQDNGEIRSTGGSISNYAIIAIENGQIRELYTDDIYNAQAIMKLKGKVYRTPASMMKGLSGVSFSFPLVNWDPNLDNTLLSSEQFVYDLGKGNSLDGIITLDTVFIQRLLDKWGGIEVPGESELINSENFYPRVFKEHSNDLVSEPRPSVFLADFFNTIITKIFSRKIMDNKDVYEVIKDSIDEKHILFSFKNLPAQSYLNENGWVSNLDQKFGAAPIDIDWNWGGNKANLYIKKNHTLNIQIKDEKTIDYTYQITIENDSEKQEFPQGEYKNYIRVYIPYNAELTSLRGLTDSNYSVYLEDGYKVVAGWFNIPIQKTLTLEIKYRLNKINESSYFPLLKTDKNYQMNIDIFKQPGSRNDSYSLSLSYPSEWVVENSEGLTRIENNVNRRFELSSDQHLYISWQR